MANDAVVGKDCKAYYSTGTYTTPVWVEITAAQDVSVTLGKNEATIASREVTWELTGAGQKTASIEMGYLHSNVADTVFDALLASYVSDTVRDMAFMDGNIATSANQGLRAYMICTGMDQDQGLNDAVGYTFTFRPTRFDDSGTLRNPAWYEVP